MKKLTLASLSLAAFLLITTCDNGFDILDKIETEVKIANEKFLVIESVSPSDLSSNVDPGNEINIVFDRALNINSLTANTLTIYNEDIDSETGFTVVNYNQRTHILTVEPEDSYFENEDDYTITISGLRGSDGSELQEDYIWFFSTGTAPAGSILVVDRDGFAESNYTNEIEVNVGVLSSNEIASSYALSLVKDEVDHNYSSFNAESLIWTDKADIYDDFELSSSEGLQPVYVVFRGLVNAEYAYSQVENYNITLDTSDPVLENVSINGGATYSTDTSLSVAISVSDAVPDLCSYRYRTSDDGTFSTWIDFSSASATFSATVDPGDNVEKTIYVEARDAAGNLSTLASDTILVDTVAPGKPSFTSTSEDTDSTNLNWTWSEGSGTYSNYERNLNYSSTWTNTTGTSYGRTLIKAEASTGARYTLRVRAEDAAGNVSSYDTCYFNYFPSADLYLEPDNGATDVSRTTNFNWADFTGADGYFVYGWIDGNSPPTDPVDVSTSYMNPPITFDDYQTIYWYYEPYDENRFGIKTIIGTSPTYTFTTGK
jgi:hypothetical protein